MAPTDSRPIPGEPDAIAPVPAAIRPLSRSRIWAIALGAGVAAGFVAWLAGELFHDFFRPRLHEVQALGIKALKPSKESLNAASLANGTLADGLLGGMIGLALGLAGGLACRSPLRGIKVGIPSLLAGAIVAAVGSIALIPLLSRGLVPDTNDLLTPILIHGGIWMAIGAVGGAAFAWGMNRRRQIAVAAGAACVGGFLASVLYHLIDAGVFPDSDPTEPISKSALVRSLSMLLPALFIAVGSARGSLERERGASPS